MKTKSKRPEKPGLAQTKRDLTVRFTADEQAYVEDLSQELSVDPDPDSVVSALGKLASQIAFWQLMEAALEKEIAKQTAEYDLEYSKSYDKVHQRLSADKSIRVTKDLVESNLATKRNLQTMQEALRQLKGELLDVQAGRKALYVHKDAVIEIARMLRTQMALTGQTDMREQKSKNADRRLRQALDLDD